MTALPDWMVRYGEGLTRHRCRTRRSFRPEHCLLVVEVMSPDSVTTDQIDKPAEYAAFGILHFWRVELELDLEELR
jgi:Uma2 family endonuclease